MYNPWLIYGGIVLGMIIYTAIVSYIFLHIGFNRGYEIGVYETKRSFRKNRRHKKNQYDTGAGSVRVLPHREDRPVYIDRGLR